MKHLRKLALTSIMSAAALSAAAMIPTGALSASPELRTLPRCWKAPCFDYFNTDNFSNEYHGELVGEKLRFKSDGKALATVNGTLQCNVAATTDVTTATFMLEYNGRLLQVDEPIRPGVFKFNVHHPSTYIATTIPIVITRTFKVKKNREINLYAVYAIRIGRASRCIMEVQDFFVQFFPSK